MGCGCVWGLLVIRGGHKGRVGKLEVKGVVSIYERWGKLVYKKANPMELG